MAFEILCGFMHLNLVVYFLKLHWTVALLEARFCCLVSRRPLLSHYLAGCGGMTVV